MSLFVSTSLLGIGLGGQALAQSTPPAAPEDSGQIVVTGSRIVQRDYVANSPIISYSDQAIARTGAVTVETALTQLPQFTTGTGATTTGYFATGQATLNLRGLGPQRNLVLLDGHRLQPSNSQQVVDINMIPRALLENVEVITGGASAVYGSDAMAGVVNFKLKKHFSGVQIDAEYNPTQRYGGAPQDYSATAGGNFADGRGNAVISATYTKRGTINFLKVPFYKNFAGLTDFTTGQGVYEPSGNGPSQAALSRLFATYGTASPTPSTLLSFNPDGTLFGATNGLSNFKGGLGLFASPDGQSLRFNNISSTVQTPIKRYTLFGRAGYDLGGGIEAFVQGQFADYTTQTIAEAGNTTLSIPVTNPFIPANLKALLASRADPTAPLSLDKRFYEAGPRIYTRTFDVYQLTAGLSGPIHAVDGTWEVYASHGSTREIQDTKGSMVASALTTLLNAPDGGASICAGGYNAFGLTTLSQACQSYLLRDPLQVTVVKQDVVEATAQGHIMRLPAGDLSFAVGATYRSDSYSFRPDSDIALGTIVGVAQSGASSGSINSKEGYVEILAPVLKDLPFVKKFDIDAAYRYSKYNLAGGVNAYKVDANWMVNDMLRFRGGYQRAVRAPNVGELFLAPTAGFGTIGNPTIGDGDPCNATSKARAGANAAAISTLCVAQGVPSRVIGSLYTGQSDVPSTNVGNTKLTPETADTYTIGAVVTSPFTPPVVSHMTLSVDYYSISIKNVIGTITAQQSLAKCFNTDGSNPSYSLTNTFCSLIARDPSTGQITSILQPTLNLGAYKTQGVDIQFNWRVNLSDTPIAIPGSVVLNSAVSRLIKFDVQSEKGGAFADYANTVSAAVGGSFGSLPKWKALTDLSYQNSVWDAGIRWHYLSGMRSLSTVSDPTSTTPGTSAYNLFDIYGNVKVTKFLNVGLGVNNLFDKSPPIVDGIPGTTEPSTYDILGRSFFLSAQIKL